MTVVQYTWEVSLQIYYADKYSDSAGKNKALKHFVVMLTLIFT